MNVLIAGDFAPRGRNAKQIDEGDFCDIFPDVLVNIIKSADYSLVNFESPIAENSFKPIAKCGPNMKCNEFAVDAIRYAGFKAVTLSNNHILDYGAKGLQKTVACCLRNGLDVVGVGSNLGEAENILYVQQGEKRLAVINCCEHEFSIASETSAGANPLNPIRQYYAIKRAKANADFVLVIVHGGHEHYQLPTERMQETYRFFIDSGADTVVNHHQHCYSGYERYNQKPIFYGLGNFCFDGNRAGGSKTWNEGYMVSISFQDGQITFELYPYIQYAERASVEILDSTTFDNNLQELNATIADKENLRKANNTYYNESKQALESVLEPIQNRYIRAAQRRHLIPSFITNKWLIRIGNHILCESHRDKLIHFLKQI